MSEAIVALLVVCAFGVGVLGTYTLLKKGLELKLAEGELKLNAALAKAMQENKKLEKEYAQLQSQIKALNSSSGADEFNQLYEAIRKQLSSDGQSKP